MFILDRVNRELHSLERLELKIIGSSSEFFDKIPVRILLDVLPQCSHQAVALRDSRKKN